MNFGKQLETFRKKNNFSKTELANKLEVTQPYITLLESGDKKPPTLEKCKQLVKILKLKGLEAYNFVFSAISERSPDSIEFLKWRNSFVQKIAKEHDFNLNEPNVKGVMLDNNVVALLTKYPEINEAIKDDNVLILLKLWNDISDQNNVTIKNIVKKLLRINPEKLQAILLLLDINHSSSI